MQRRTLLTGMAATLGLAACSSTSTPSTTASPTVDPSAPAALRLMWWGSDDRQKKTRAAVDLFMQRHPNITVTVEPTAYDGYFDKLNTQIAAGNAPDVQQLAIELVRDFVSRKTLLPLSAVNTSKLDAATTAQGNFDKVQYTVASGLATTSVVANKALFAKANIPMPDDSTWTWDDYRDISARLTTTLGKGFFGSGPMVNDWNLFGAFIRQQGDGVQLFTDDAKLGFEAKHAQAFFELLKELQDAGATPSASEQFEDITKSIEQTGVAQNRHVMGFLPSSQYQALAKASGQGIVPLRLPSENGTAKGSKMAIGASQMWGVFSKTKYPAAAQMLVDFLVNDKEAGEQLLVSRGSAPNSDVRAAIASKLDPSEATISQFITDISPDTVGNPLPPAGLNTVQDMLRRWVSDFMFGKTTAAAAATGLVAEITSSIRS